MKMKKINPLKRLDLACFLRSQLYLAPVLLLFYQQNGLTIADFVLFQGIFQLTGILFEIPCGYIADVISKKKVLVLAFVCFFLRAALWLSFSGMYIILLGELFNALSRAFLSGVYDSYIYSVEGDQISPSYYVDKGQHSVLLDFELWFKDEEKANREAGVHHITVNENRKYVMGSYFFKERYYYFVHDKSNGKTCNYVSIDDDILFSLSFPIKYFPSVYFDSWNNFDDHYIYFYYRPRAFIRKVDRLKEHLSPSGWDEFCRKHPDIIKIYQENDRDAFVIISYKFR